MPYNKLYTAHLAYNRFSSIEASGAHVTDLNLAFNLLTGLLPEEFGTLTALNTLNLLGNNYTVKSAFRSFIIPQPAWFKRSSSTVISSECPLCDCFTGVNSARDHVTGRADLLSHICQLVNWDNAFHTRVSGG